MASSSSSSQLIPTSSSQSWNHDVFLSFRGKDTRKNFVNHLYTALVQKGIYVYKDDETLARGESIGQALLKAIRESRIAIIIFSKNYADSSWCLDELAYIIECMDTRRQIVLPVFYDIDPSDVRKLNGKFGEAFVKHELDNKHKVESWRKALVKSGNLSGWVPNDFANGHEAECIKDIVDTISSKLSPQITNVNKDLIGIETRLQDLKTKMETGSGGVRMVGIWGVGGGGKTTLASTAYTELSHEFEASCFLENIRDESNKHGLRRLQENFLSFILKTEVKLWSQIEGESLIKRRLCHKSVLIVLDDVDDLKQIEVLAGSNDWFGDESRIIITTRDEHLLKCKADVVYEVSLLSHDEAIKLFSRRAYRKEKPVEDYEMLSKEVVSYAGGLPLALEILGSFLCDKDRDQWKSALAKLKSKPNAKVMERLKISYDGLEHDEKELFLDIACFLRKWSVDRAMRVLDACSFHPGIGVKVLVQKSLIKISNERFDMHDLVEEMAHYIVRGEHPNHPEKHSRIWQEKDVVEFCAMGAEAFVGNNNIEVLALPRYITHSDLPSLGYIKDDLFQSYARRLELFRSSLPSYVSDPRLPDVVANMKKLRWIYWEGYPTTSFPTNFQPTKLGCLISIWGRQKQLWEGRKDLPNLKILDLRYSYLLERTPNFDGLPCLERLILEDCKSLQEIHPSIGYHGNLVLVNMKGCSKLKTFPPIIRMKKLETLDLSDCSKLQKFPDIQTSMDSLVILRLVATPIIIIPSSVGHFCTNLVSLDLSNCYKLKRIEGNFRLLKSLKDFHLNGCDELEELTWKFFDKECCLEVLSLAIKSQKSTSKNLKNRICIPCFHQNWSVSPKLPQFPRFLRKLDLSWCNLGDGDIPSDISELLNLQILDLSRNQFSRLDSSLSRIPCLKFLNLSWCTKLVELPDLPSSIAILKADWCLSLQSLGDLSDYKCLWKVSLYGCKELIDYERALRSMLEVNAVEDRFMSVELPHRPLMKSLRSDTRTLITLQLPHNWYDDFSGFLLCADDYFLQPYTIVIKQKMSMDSQLDHDQDHWEEFDKNPESYKYGMMGYVPFGSLRHTSLSNSTCTHISFEIKGLHNPKVGLVPRKSQICESTERPKATLEGSELWDQEMDGRNTFEIKYDPN